MVQSISVPISETYDLSTTKDRMGLIAIRTPNMPAIQKRYPGFIRNFRFLRVKSCDVVISCASSLPADPLQIGTQAGQIAPQDMFNPILYKAVSNDSWNGMLSRIYAGGTGTSSDSLGGAVRYFKDAFPTASASDIMKAYYALLSDPSFKKAHVQSGLEMRHLVPLVYHVLNANGTMPTNRDLQVATYSDVSKVNYIDGTGAPAVTQQLIYNGAGTLKGRPVPMPPVETTTYVYNATDGTVTNAEFTPVPSSIVPTYVAAIVIPPASLNITYFRMTVRWNVEFFGVASDIAKGLTLTNADIGSYAYLSYVSNQQTLTANKISDVSDTAVNADDENIQRCVEADGVTLDLIMEK